ncbi:MAG: hypothetical protein QM541_08315 [Flavobacterium sp.]|nr:hypothetical protein [Flavobacterium sp.]
MPKGTLSNWFVETRSKAEPLFSFSFCPFFACRWQSVCFSVRFSGSFLGFGLGFVLWCWFWFGFLCSLPALKALWNGGFKGKGRKKKKQAQSLDSKGLRAKM